MDKLKILTDVFNQQGENSRRFLTSIYTNNIEDKIKNLTETGHCKKLFIFLVSLALLAARIHGKKEHEETIIENTRAIGKPLMLNEQDVEDIKSKMRAAVPMKSVFSLKNKAFHADWVTHTELKRSGQSNLDNILSQKEEESEEKEEGGFKFEGVEVNKESVQTNKVEQKKKIESKWNDEEEDDDEEIKKILEEKSKNSKITIQSLTIGEEDRIYTSFNNSTIPGVQTALGNLKVTFNFLKTQLGICSNYDNLKSVMKNIYMSSFTQISLIPCLKASNLQIRQTKNGTILPQNGVTIKGLQDLLEIGYGMVSENNMQEAQNIFRNVINNSIFFIASDKNEDSLVKNIIMICTEYIYLTKLCLLADQIKQDKVKYAELCCIMSFCKLELPIHKFLIYKKAKVACKNIKNYISALVFIKKMLAFEKEVSL
jgi:hypothetical protein